MFIEERHEKILQMLKDKKRVEVQELSELFEVSEDTIRRDLRIMERFIELMEVPFFLTK